MSKSVKILISGDVKGRFDELFSKVAKVNSSAHGPFQALFCVGQFFSSSDTPSVELLQYIDENKAIPIPTYFIAGEEKGVDTERIDLIQDGGVLCKNLEYLGREGVKTVAGLDVAYLSGSYDPVLYGEAPSATRDTKYETHYLQLEVEELLKKNKIKTEGIDLLLTAEWGKGFQNLLPEKQRPKGFAGITTVGSTIVAELASTIPTRYHFAGTENYYFQLPPYRNEISCTRFYGMASIEAPPNQKSLYACNVGPLKIKPKRNYEAQFRMMSRIVLTLTKNRKKKKRR